MAERLTSIVIVTKYQPGHEPGKVPEPRIHSITTTCGLCSAQVSPADAFCRACGSKFTGSREEAR